MTADQLSGSDMLKSKSSGSDEISFVNDSGAQGGGIVGADRKGR